MTPYRSTVTGARDGFDRLLLAEWTKLRSVPRWLLTLTAAVLLTVLFALITATGTERATAGGGGPGPRPPVGIQDGGHFVHRTLAGDGDLVAQVREQRGSHPNAKAGLMIREGTKPGSRYAAVVVTPERGVRLQSGFGGEDVARVPGTAPRWLKLARSGATITAYESADGAAWNRVGAVKLGGLPEKAEIGMFVASPDASKVQRQFGSETIDGGPTEGGATFGGVRPHPDQAGTPWRDLDRRGAAGGQARESAGTFTLTGSGDIGPDPFAEDMTRTTLTGATIGVLAVVALAVLFVTAEYKRGTIRTTFAASPRRGRVLAAKAIVIGTATFAAGLVAALAALVLAGPILRSNGAHPPGLTEWTVLRAALGTGALTACIAVLGLGVAAVLRHTAAAITVVLLPLLIPQIIATGLPLSAAKWLERLTPAAGFAAQQTVRRYDTALGPYAGLAVLAAYAAAALALAVWRVRRSDP